MVSGLVGYLMSLPSVRQELDLDNMDSRASWPARMKKMVVKLATEVESNLIAYNGAANRSFFLS